MMISRIFAPIGLLLLMGCAEATAPEEKGPETPVSVSAQPEVRVPAQTTLNLAISRAKTSDTRDFLVALQELFQSDPAVQSGLIRSNALGSEATALKSPLRPELSLNGTTYNGVSLRLSQPLLDFGKRKARVQAVIAEQAGARQELAEIQGRLLNDAVDALLSYQFAQDRISVHRRQIADFNAARRAAERMVAMDLLTSAELRLAEVEAQQAAIALVRAERDSQEAEQTWSRLFGQRPIPRRFDPRPLRAAAGVDGADVIAATALQRNLTMRSLEVDAGQLASNAEVIRRRNTPTLSAAIEVGTRNTRRDVAAGLSVTYPIYNRDRQIDLSSAEANIKASQSERVATGRDLQFELKQQSLNAANARTLAGKQRAAMRLLEQRIADVEFQMESGLATYPDVIDARADFFDTWIDLTESQNAARRAEAEIILLSGVLVPLL